MTECKRMLTNNYFVFGKIIYFFHLIGIIEYYCDRYKETNYSATVSWQHPSLGSLNFFIKIITK